MVAADAEDATVEVSEGVNEKGLDAPEPKPVNPPNFWGSWIDVALLARGVIRRLGTHRIRRGRCIGESGERRGFI